ncbi:MAG: hypothetical protein QG622_336 [Actinomycetota bacterium]|nr:hypothetical protein [Actinomycetota bacterium]
MLRNTVPRFVSAVLFAGSVLVPSPAPSEPPPESQPESQPAPPERTTGGPLPKVRLPLPGAVEPSSPVAVLPAVSAGPAAPTTAGLTAVIGPLLARPALGTSVSAEVIDVATGTTIFSKNAARVAAPASSAKILTAAAALASLGPDTTLPTRAVAGTSAGEVVLVGGGDVLLAPGKGDPDSTYGHAGLADLADRTAASLRRTGTSTVTVRLDDTLFAGPSRNPLWAPGDVVGGFVAPVMSLEVMVGITRPTAQPRPGLPAPRLPDPAMSAAKRFATLLTARGIAVSGQVARARAPQQAEVLGEVRSASVADVVELALADSDNTVAEALARLVAIGSGRQATFADGGRAVLDKVAELGVPTAGAQMAGGSGLGRGTLVSAAMIARTLSFAGSSDQPRLRPVLTGLPVAGASGTLAGRFAGTSQAAGVGVVRAKTGTLTRVSSLAGTVVDADGRLLAFTVLADAVPATLPGRAALDTAGAALARCGCR